MKALASNLFVQQSKEYVAKAKSFLSPQSTREKKLSIAYSGLGVFVSILIGLFSGGDGGGGGSKPVFVVSNVYTYPQWKMTFGINQDMCGEMNQQSEYNDLLAKKWSITSTQQEERSVSAPDAGGFTTGKCIGTLYIFSK